MFKNSNELLDYSLREIQVAVSSNEGEVKIVLDECFKGEKKDIVKLTNELKMKEITEKLREKFSDYTVRSIVGPESLNAIITYKTGPCDILYRLVWTLTLQKKAS